MRIGRKLMEKLLGDCCPEHRKALEKCVVTGDMDKELSDHLDGCPVCTRVAELAKKQRNAKP